MSTPQQSSHEQDTNDQFRAEMTIQVRTLNDKVTRILDLVQGQHIGTAEQKKGIIGIVDDHDDRIDKLERLRTSMTWFLIGISAPAGYGILSFIRELFIK